MKIFDQHHAILVSNREDLFLVLQIHNYFFWHWLDLAILKYHKKKANNPCDIQRKKKKNDQGFLGEIILLSKTKIHVKIHVADL